MASSKRGARAAFGRVRDAVAAFVRFFPLTPFGLCTLAGGAWAFFHFGVDRIDLILLVIGLVVFGLTVVSTLATLIAGILAWTRFRDTKVDDQLEVECGFPVPTGFSLPRLWWLPLVALRWRWVSPEARVRISSRGFRVEEEVIASRRGVVGAVVRELEVGDVFGMSRIAFRIRERRRVRFVPSVGALKKVDVIRGMAGGDDISHPDGPQEGELYDLRHYTPGDPIRFVLWKVFAKSRQLVVRSPERALSPVRQTVAYLVAHRGDEAAAGACRLAVEHGVLGNDWKLGADGVHQDAASKDEALEILARSSESPDRSAATGLPEFLRRNAHGSVGRAVVFVPGHPGKWIDSIIASVGAGGRVEFIVGTDGVVPTPRSTWLAKFAVEAKRSPVAAGATAPSTSAEVAEIVKRLSKVGRVTVVDRVAGRVFAHGHLDVLLEREAA